MKISRIFLLLCLPLICWNGIAQKQFKGDVIKTVPGKKDIVILSGHVKITANGNHVYCDYSEYNLKTASFTGQGNLRIHTKEKTKITGEKLDYNASTQIYHVVGNVVLKDKDVTLQTPHLIFNGATNRANFLDSTKIISGETVLTSKKGYYEGRNQSFFCEKDVVIVNPEYTIRTDTIHYFSNGFADFLGPTRIQMPDYYTYSEKGWFHNAKNQISLKKNAYIQTLNDQFLYGDSIYYDLKKKRGKIFDHVFFKDSANDCYLFSDYAENDEVKGYAFFSRQPRGFMILHQDSIFVRGDTLYLTYDQKKNISHFYAFRNVRIFNQNYQGRSDSLVYDAKDSVIYFLHQPMLWAQGYQLDGDSIRLWLKNDAPHRAYVNYNVFMTSRIPKTPKKYFNQVQAHELELHFDSTSNLHYGEARGRVETIYYIIDNDANELIGVNKAKCDLIRLFFAKSELEGVRFIKPKETGIYPVDQLTPRQRQLKKFRWYPELQPLSKYDIFPVW